MNANQEEKRLEVNFMRNITPVNHFISYMILKELFLNTPNMNNLLQLQGFIIRMKKLYPAIEKHFRCGIIANDADIAKTLFDYVLSDIKKTYSALNSHYLKKYGVKYMF